MCYKRHDDQAKSGQQIIKIKSNIHTFNDMEPIVHTVFEPKTSTWQYVVADPTTKAAVIIDPVLDFDKEKQSISTESADSLLQLVNSHGYNIVRLLETHAHADHLTAASYLQTALQAKSNPPICIGHRITTVQQTFAAKYAVPDEDLRSAFNHLFTDDETFAIGSLTAQVLHLPGHTPDHAGYLIGTNVFTGDSMFNPDVGSARCDFPGGDAQALWGSMKRLLSLPPHYKLYTGHDYPPKNDDGNGIRAPMPFTTVAEQKEQNKHANDMAAEREYVGWRAERDSGLNEPKLLHQAMQVNIRGGRLPKEVRQGEGVFMQFRVSSVPEGLQ